MNRDELRSGASAGLVAAAATAGTLLGIGRRSATAAKPFNVEAAHLLGRRAADTFAFVPGITLTGLAFHMVLSILFGIAVLGIVRRGLSPLWLASAGTSILACLVSIGIARRGDPSLADLLSVGDLVVYYIVLAASLVAGIRFALPPSAIR